MEVEAKTQNTLVYFLNNTMYINLTNLCTNKCVFCIRGLNDSVAGADLRLENENVDAQTVIEEIKQNEPENRHEIVFCGYGEPLIKIEVIKEVARFIKKNYPNVPVRVNTNGQANLIHRRNVVSELVGLIDRISVSLIAENADVYEELTKCKFDKKMAYESVKNFMSTCVDYGIQTTATVVVGYKNYKINVEKCKKIAEELGVDFKIREWLDEGYK